MSMSWTDRAALRGAISERLFLSAMREAGFRTILPRHGYTWEFRHPATGERCYSVPFTERYSAALPRLRHELEAARMAEVAP
jgi:hypothetical protein